MRSINLTCKIVVSFSNQSFVDFLELFSTEKSFILEMASLMESKGSALAATIPASRPNKNPVVGVSTFVSNRFVALYKCP